jgi:hypothetical protein
MVFETPASAMVDWTQAEEQLAHLGITAEEGFYFALFPPKPNPTNQGCEHIEVSGEIDRQRVERELARRPGFGFGFIPNWGGSKDAEIAYCRALFYEDDNPDTTCDVKKQQWEHAGLPHPSLQMWTGGKSVHNYWILDQPCSGAEFRAGQVQLFTHVIRNVSGAMIDTKLCNPARVMRLAGGKHPETGEVSRVISATGERFPLSQLMALTAAPDLHGADVQASTTRTRKGLLSREGRDVVGKALPRNDAPQRAQPAPDRDLDPKAYAAFVRAQEAYDGEYKPTGLHFSALTYDEKVRTTISALPFCPERLEPGSNTYGDAFAIYAAIVNEFGAKQAVSIAKTAKWSTEHWDLEDQAHAIARSSRDRTGVPHKRIYHVFDTAEFNGWSRPWPILREIRKDQRKTEDDDLLRELRQTSFKQWSKSAAAHLTLASVFHPRIAELLGGRAEAFPVAHTALIAPFITTMCAVIGKRFRVQIKAGWREPLVFWMGTVAPASSLKTPVANQFLGPLLTLDANDQRAYKRELMRYKAVPKEERGDAPELPRQRVVMDATLEGLCTLLERESVHGVVSFHDELAAFIGDMDKYRSNNSDRAHWLSMWSGGSINIVRKGCDPIMVDRTAVNVFGAIQQDKLTELLHGDDATAKSGDGFWARFLWIVPEYVFPKQNLSEVEITRELEAMIYELDTSIGRKKVVKLSQEAWSLFAEVCDEWSSEADATYASRAAFLGKMRGYLARTAGLLHALDYAADPPGQAMSEVIERDVMERAVILCRFFICQFDVLAPQVGGGDLPSWVVKIVTLAQTNGTGIVTHRDLVLKKWASSGGEARQMLERLVSDYGVGRLVHAVRRDQTRWQLSG